MIQLTKNTDAQQGQSQTSNAHEDSTENWSSSNAGDGSTPHLSNSNLHSKDNSEASYQEFSELLQELLEMGEMEDETGTSASKDYNLLCMDLDNSNPGSPETVKEETVVTNEDKNEEKAVLLQSEMKMPIEIAKHVTSKEDQNQGEKGSLINESSDRFEEAIVDEPSVTSQDKESCQSNDSGAVLSSIEVGVTTIEPIDDTSNGKQNILCSVDLATSDTRQTGQETKLLELKSSSEKDLHHTEEKYQEGSHNAILPSNQIKSSELPEKEVTQNITIPINESVQLDYSSPPLNVSKEISNDITDSGAQNCCAMKRTNESDKENCSGSSCEPPSPPEKKVKIDEMSESNNEVACEIQDESQSHSDHLPVVKVLIVVDNKVVVCSSNQKLANNEMKDIDKIFQYIPDVSKSHSDEKSSLQSTNDKTVPSTDVLSTSPLVSPSSIPSTSSIAPGPSALVLSTSDTSTSDPSTLLPTSSVPSTLSSAILSTSSLSSLSTTIPSTSVSTILVPLTSATSTSDSSSNPSTSNPSASNLSASNPSASNPSSSNSSTSNSSTSNPSTSVPTISIPSLLVPSTWVPSTLVPQAQAPENFESSPVSNISPCPAEVNKRSSNSVTNLSEIKIMNAKSYKDSNALSHGKSLWLKGIKRLKQHQLALKLAEIKQLADANNLGNLIAIHEKNTQFDKNYSFSHSKDLILKAEEKNESLSLQADNSQDINPPISSLSEAYKDLPLPNTESESMKPLSIEDKRILAKKIYSKVKELMKKYTNSTFSKDIQKSTLVKDLNISKNDLNKVSPPWSDIQNDTKDSSSSMTICNKFSDDNQSKYSSDHYEAGIDYTVQSAPKHPSVENRDDKWDYASFSQMQNYSWSTQDKMRSHSFSPHQNNKKDQQNTSYTSPLYCSNVKRKIQETIIKKHAQSGKIEATNPMLQSEVNDRHNIESDHLEMVEKPKLSDQHPYTDSTYTMQPISNKVALNQDFSQRNAPATHLSGEDNSANLSNRLCSQRLLTPNLDRLANDLPYIHSHKPSSESVIKSLQTVQIQAAKKTNEINQTINVGYQNTIRPASPYYNSAVASKALRPIIPTHQSSLHCNTPSNNIKSPEFHQACQSQLFVDNRTFHHQQTTSKDFKKSSSEQETVHLSFSHNSMYESSNSKSHYENSQQSCYATTNREFINREETQKMKSIFSSVDHQSNPVSPQEITPHHYGDSGKNLRIGESHKFPFPSHCSSQINSSNARMSDYPNKQNYTPSHVLYAEESMHNNSSLKHLPEIHNSPDFGPLSSRSKDSQECIDYSKTNYQYKNNATYQFENAQQELKLKKDRPEFNRGNFGTLPHNQINSSYYPSIGGENRQSVSKVPREFAPLTSFPKMVTHQNEVSCNNSSTILGENNQGRNNNQIGRVNNQMNESQAMLYSESISRTSSNSSSDYSNHNRQLFPSPQTFGTMQNRSRYHESLAYHDKNSNYSNQFDETGLFINDTSCQNNTPPPPSLPFDPQPKATAVESFNPTVLTKNLQKEDSSQYNSNFSDISSDDNLQQILNETDFALSLPPISTILTMKGQADSHEKPQHFEAPESNDFSSNITSQSMPPSGNNEKYYPFSNTSQQKDMSPVYPNYNQSKSADNFTRTQNAIFPVDPDLVEPTKKSSSNFFMPGHSNNSSYDNWHQKNVYQEALRMEKQSANLNYLEMQKRNLQSEKEYMEWEPDWQTSTKQKTAVDYQTMGYYTSAEESPVPMLNPFSKKMFEKQERYNASLQNTIKSGQLYSKKKDAQKYFANASPVRRKRGRPRKIRTDDCLYTTQKSSSKRQKREKPSSWMQHLLNFSSNFILEQKLKEELGKKKRRHSVKNLANYPRSWHIPPLQMPQHFYFANNKYSQNNSTPQNDPQKQESNPVDTCKKLVVGTTTTPNLSRDIFAKTNDMHSMTTPEKNPATNLSPERSENYSSYKSSKSTRYNPSDYNMAEKEESSKHGNTIEISEESESDNSSSSEESSSSSSDSSSSDMSDNDETYQIIHPQPSEHAGKNQFHLNKIIIRRVGRTVPKSSDPQSKNLTTKEQTRIRDKVHIEVERKDSGTNQFNSFIDMHIEAETVGIHMGSSSKEIDKITQVGEKLSRVVKEGSSFSVKVDVSSNVECKDLLKLPKESIEKIVLEREEVIVNEVAVSKDTNDSASCKKEMGRNSKYNKSTERDTTETNDEIPPLADELSREKLPKVTESATSEMLCQAKDHVHKPDEGANCGISEDKDKMDSDHLSPLLKEKGKCNKTPLESVSEDNCEISRYSSEGYKYRVVVEIKDTITETILEQSINIGKRENSQNDNIPEIKIDVTKTKHVVESVVKQPARTIDQESEPLTGKGLTPSLAAKENCELVIQETVKSAEIEMKHWESENLNKAITTPSRMAHFVTNQEQTVKQSQVKNCSVRLQRVSDSLIENGSVNLKFILPESENESATLKLLPHEGTKTELKDTFHEPNPTEYLKQSKKRLTFMMRRKTLSLNKKNTSDGTEAASRLHDYKKDTEYSCPICNFKTKDILQILLHITKHGFALAKICPVCYKSFPTEVLTCHIHCQHSRTNQGNACQMCGELLDSLSNLQEHLHIIHLRCMFCGIMRMKKAALYNHIITCHVPEIRKAEALCCEKADNQGDTVAEALEIQLTSSKDDHRTEKDTELQKGDHNAESTETLLKCNKDNQRTESNTSLQKGDPVADALKTLPAPNSGNTKPKVDKDQEKVKSVAETFETPPILSKGNKRAMTDIDQKKKDPVTEAPETLPTSSNSYKKMKKDTDPKEGDPVAETPETATTSSNSYKKIKKDTDQKKESVAEVLETSLTSNSSYKKMKKDTDQKKGKFVAETSQTSPIFSKGNKRTVTDTDQRKKDPVAEAPETPPTSSNFHKKIKKDTDEKKGDFITVIETLPTSSKSEQRMKKDTGHKKGDTIAEFYQAATSCKGERRSNSDADSKKGDLVDEVHETQFTNSRCSRTMKTGTDNKKGNCVDEILETTPTSNRKTDNRKKTDPDNNKGVPVDEVLEMVTSCKDDQKTKRDRDLKKGDIVSEVLEKQSTLSKADQRRKKDTDQNKGDSDTLEITLKCSKVDQKRRKDTDHKKDDPGTDTSETMPTLNTVNKRLKRDIDQKKDDPGANPAETMPTLSTVNKRVKRDTDQKKDDPVADPYETMPTLSTVNKRVKRDIDQKKDDPGTDTSETMPTLNTVNKRLKRDIDQKKGDPVADIIDTSTSSKYDQRTKRTTDIKKGDAVSESVAKPSISNKCDLRKKKDTDPKKEGPVSEVLETPSTSHRLDVRRRKDSDQKKGELVAEALETPITSGKGEQRTRRETDHKKGEPVPESLETPLISGKSESKTKRDLDHKKGESVAENLETPLTSSKREQRTRRDTDQKKGESVAELLETSLTSNKGEQRTRRETEHNKGLSDGDIESSTSSSKCDQRMKRDRDHKQGLPDADIIETSSFRKGDQRIKKDIDSKKGEPVADALETLHTSSKVEQRTRRYIDHKKVESVADTLETLHTSSKLEQRTRRDTDHKKGEPVVEALESRLTSSKGEHRTKRDTDNKKGEPVPESVEKMSASIDGDQKTTKTAGAKRGRPSKNDPRMKRNEDQSKGDQVTEALETSCKGDQRIKRDKDPKKGDLFVEDLETPTTSRQINQRRKSERDLKKGDPVAEAVEKLSTFGKGDLKTKKDRDHIKGEALDNLSTSSKGDMKRDREQRKGEPIAVDVKTSVISNKSDQRMKKDADSKTGDNNAIPSTSSKGDQRRKKDTDKKKGELVDEAPETQLLSNKVDLRKKKDIIPKKGDPVVEALETLPTSRKVDHKRKRDLDPKEGDSVAETCETLSASNSCDQRTKKTTDNKKGKPVMEALDTTSMACKGDQRTKRDIEHKKRVPVIEANDTLPTSNKGNQRTKRDSDHKKENPATEACEISSTSNLSDQRMKRDRDHKKGNTANEACEIPSTSSPSDQRMKRDRDYKKRDPVPELLETPPTFNKNDQSTPMYIDHKKGNCIAETLQNPPISNKDDQGMKTDAEYKKGDLADNTLETVSTSSNSDERIKKDSDATKGDTVAESLETLPTSNKSDQTAEEEADPQKGNCENVKFKKLKVMIERLGETDATPHKHKPATSTKV